MKGQWKQNVQKHSSKKPDGKRFYIISATQCG
jgi:hypothetical protein